jgi:large subunit ribosomal protein L13
MITHEIDATNQSLGRLASKVAVLLRGKDSPDYQPHILSKVTVIISNIDKIKFEGSKMATKVFYHYSGYPGGMKARSLPMEWARKPREVVRSTIYRMLPNNRLRDKMIKNLKFK